MPIVRDIMDWVPGVVKLSGGSPVPDTSIVFPESAIHPSITDPNVGVAVQEEQMLIFMHSLCTELYLTQFSIPEADIPPGFQIRRVYSLDVAPDQGTIRWSIDIPVETSLLFGRRTG